MFSPAKPRGARRDIINSWQPASSGVTDGRLMRSMASSRVGDSDIRWPLWSWVKDCFSVDSVAKKTLLVISVQLVVKLNRGFVGFALHRAGQAVATEQQVILAGQVAGFDDFYQVVIVVQQVHLGAGGDVQACFNRAAVAQRDADAGVGAQQAVFAYGDDDVTAARQGAHSGAAATQVGALADDHAGGDAPFDHAGAFGTGVEVDETFVHDGSAFAHVGAQTNPGGVGDAHALGYHVVGHLRELVYRFHFEGAAFNTGLQLTLRQLVQVDGTFVGPGQVRQQAENTVQLQGVGPGQAMGNQVQLQVHLRGAGCGVVCRQYGNHHRALAVGSLLGQLGLLGLAQLAQGVSKLAQLLCAGFDGLVAAFVVQRGFNHVDQVFAWGHDRLLVVNLQPLALVVLAADANAECKTHLICSCTKKLIEFLPRNPRKDTERKDFLPRAVLIFSFFRVFPWIPWLKKKSVCPRSPLVCVKAHAYLVAPFNHRAFDDGGVLQHDLVGTLGANGITNLIRKFPPGGAPFVDQRFPT